MEIQTDVKDRGLVLLKQGAEAVSYTFIYLYASRIILLFEMAPTPHLGLLFSFSCPYLHQHFLF